MDSSVCYKVNVHCTCTCNWFIGLCEEWDHWLIYTLVVFYKRVTLSFPSIFNFFLCRYIYFSSQCSKLRFFFLTIQCRRWPTLMLEKAELFFHISCNIFSLIKLALFCTHLRRMALRHYYGSLPWFVSLQYQYIEIFPFYMGECN